MLIPRDYQQESADKALAHMRNSKDPGVLVLTTAAGKSVVIAVLAKVVQAAGKRVLCLAPSGDLIEQNASKYRAVGEDCSLFSASLNRKHTGHPVVFATPKSVVNSLDDFNDEYALLIIDECHLVNDDDYTAYQKIIFHLTYKNPKLRILGLTATPMRGKAKLVGKENTFKHIIHELPHHILSGLGWVTPYSIGKVSENYDLKNINVQSNGEFRQSEIDNATLNKERLTRLIIDDMINIMLKDNRKCCMIFAASIKHAEEIISYLPDGEAMLITGKTVKGKRRNALEDTRHGKWRYLVTVGALTTGVDLPIVDTISLLRATSSIGLLLQILGRGCRLYDTNWTGQASELNCSHADYDGKKDCLVLDYGQNIDRFSLDDDLTITGLVDAKNKQDDDDEFFEIACPTCQTLNRHTAQRCVGISREGVRCDYRFIFKICEPCGATNSPSARHCHKCDAELINPNDKLTRKASIVPGTPFQVAVIDMTMRSHWRSGSQSLRVDYTVTDGSTSWMLSEFMRANNYPFHKFTQQVGAIGNTIENVILEAKLLTMPTRLMIKRQKDSKYYSIVTRYVDKIVDSQNQLEMS